MSAELAWFKSSYSDSSGSACLEVAYTWRKSSHSGDFDNACVEIAACPHTIHVRDSKLGARSPRFSVPADAWVTFIAYATTGA
ncbi:DUF397 domain-containing protein [Streptomyces lanatus]|uniref:DUF397 domain-containing protein n=1 Tax=Streptomyces lanatus TaxID=66900 RepID=A0ABV1XUT9_9ACTN|nr:DUF397 domain-containing protein [Streptomyces lanatus]GHH13383.1 toxin [Streptomyces lanatus]